MSTEKSIAVDQRYRAVSTVLDRSPIDWLASVESYLWGLLVVAFVADVALTFYGRQAGLTEGNPAMHLAIDTAGIAALVGAKLAVVGFGAGVRRLLDERGAVVPLGLALPWVLATSINLSLLV